MRACRFGVFGGPQTLRASSALAQVSGKIKGQDGQGMSGLLAGPSAEELVPVAIRIRAEKVPLRAGEVGGRAPKGTVLRLIEARVLQAEAAALSPSELCFSFRKPNGFHMDPVVLIEPTKGPARDWGSSGDRSLRIAKFCSGNAAGMSRSL